MAPCSNDKKKGLIEDDDSGLSGADDQSNPSSSNNDGASGISSTNSPSNHSSSANSTGNSSYELFGFTRHHFEALSCSRWIFLASLLVAAVGLATGVFFILDNEQVEDFEAEFENLASEILNVSNEHVLNAFNIMDGVTTTVTSFIEVQAEDPNFTHPSGFLTLPHLEEHLGTARGASGASLLAYVPLIQPGELELWANYSYENQDWITESEGDGLVDASLVDPILEVIWDYPRGEEFDANLRKCVSDPNSDTDFEIDPAARIPLASGDGPFAPVWTFSPPPKSTDTTIINHNLYGRTEYQEAVRSVNRTRKPMFVDVCNLASWFNIEKQTEYLEAVIVYPVFGTFDEDATIVGHVVEIIPWAYFFGNILPEGTEPLHLVLESSCGQAATYEVRGRRVKLLTRRRDVSNDKYDAMAISSIFADFANSAELVEDGIDGAVCVYTTTIYPTVEFESTFDSQKPIHYALVVVSVFVLTSLLFFLFDFLMTLQRNKVMETAKKQNAIVSSLFPKSIQAKMMQQVEADNNKLSKVGKAGLKNYLFDTQGKREDGDEKPDADNTDQIDRSYGPSKRSKPIADLFPETTIMFGDIAGFTAWSSAREPSKVFTLLETIYHEFDRIARRRRVFKVEVVGDCYVAVCGLPDPKKDHAIVMAKFSFECVKAMNRLTQEMEVELGPETTELSLRVGLHSGPVVAGVLRGEKSRFQLFGDTMNTASRMESTGIPNRVQISQETADLLVAAGKEHWFEAREEAVQVKGKGELTTYLLKLPGSSDGNKSNKLEAISSTFSGYSSDDTLQESSGEGNASGIVSSHEQDSGEFLRRNRIADWTVEIMAALLKEVVVRRKAALIKTEPNSRLYRLEQATGTPPSIPNTDDDHTAATVIDEVQEIVELPKFNATAAHREASMDARNVSLPPQVLEELRDYVRAIASMYNENPFHNFSHANHVTMSVVKLLSRIVAPDVEAVHNTTLHDHTYGITSDPLTRFSVVFAALIHDVEHEGVSNVQLVKEEDPVARQYKNKSVAEQNSIDKAWMLLMEPRFINLRRHIYTTQAEFQRFRQLVVNSVMATDIMDRDLKNLRNKRWADAFSDVEQPQPLQPQQQQDAVNRKATIVIEHLIQASDIAHTMQHWHIYRKWNERLFQELYKAWMEGRMEQDPSENWYKGELGFLDGYVIPLAKKLKECGVFGVSSDEYLLYAIQNRKEWAARGEGLVQEMVRNAKRKRVVRSMHQHRRILSEEESSSIIMPHQPQPRVMPSSGASSSSPSDSSSSSPIIPHDAYGEGDNHATHRTVPVLSSSHHDEEFDMELKQ